MPFHILKHEAVAPGLRRIAREQIGIVLNNFADDAMPVHQQVHSLRARCKKMRALLRLPRPLMGVALHAEDQRFRAAAKQLAEYRDMDVYARTIESLDGTNDVANLPHSPVPAAAIARSLEIMTTSLDAVDRWPLDVHEVSDLAPGFSQTYRKCLDAWDAVLREPSDGNFHRLRIWTKYHWYQVRILVRLVTREFGKRRKELRELQLTLGDAHDLFLTQTILGLQDHTDTQLLQRAITRKHELYAEVMNAGREVYAVPVDELVADLARGRVT